MSSNNDAVHRFLDTVLIPIRNTDRTKYPLTPSRVKRYYLDLAARDFLAGRAALEAKGWSAERMARCFHNPSRVMRMSYYLLEGSQRLGNPPDRQRDLLQFLITLVSHLKHSDPYGFDGVNRQTATPEALDRFVADRLKPVDQAESRRFHRLAAALRTYMDAVYLVPHDVGMEMYGPYDGPALRHFVREFFNMRPTELWPETAAVSATEVRMVAAYEPSLFVEFDVFNNPYVKAGNYISLCRMAAVHIDGEPATPAQMDALTDAALRVVRKIVATMMNLSEAEQAARYIRCFWLRMRNFLESANLEPTPPPDVYERLREAPSLPAPGGAPTLENLRANLGL